MRGGQTIQNAGRDWAQSLVRLLALLAIALHIFAVQGHVHVAAFPQHGAGVSALAHGHPAPTDAAGPSLSNSSNPAPCLFCQTMAAAGAGLMPVAPLLVWFGAAALVAALFGQRHVSLQRLTTWRSRAPPLSA